MTHAYAALNPTAHTLHQLLVPTPGESLTVEAAAVLADLFRTQTQHVLDQLTNHRLLTHTAGRYRQHAQARAHAPQAQLDELQV